MLGVQSTSVILSDRITYPFFSRIVPPDDYQAKVFIDILNYLYKESGLPQYLEIGILAIAGPYGISGAQQLTNSKELTIKTYQQFLEESTDVTVEINELKNSKARVFIVIIANPPDAQIVLRTANDYGIIGESYIWFCFDGCAIDYIFHVGFTSEVQDDLRLYASGMIGVNLPTSKGTYYEETYANWLTLDPAIYPAAGPDTSMSVDAQYFYDVVIFVANVFHNLIAADGMDENGKITITTEEFYNILTNTSAVGCTGNISLDYLGNRNPSYNILNLREDAEGFQIIGSWDSVTKLTLDEKIEFNGGSTKVPDIDIRPPFNYWSCPDGKKKSDLTGKTVNVKSPGGSNPPNIDYTYYCDSFIDCGNLSDEIVGCQYNYLVLFIVFGIAAGLFILLAILFFILTIIFGFIFPRKRVRVASPTFLIIVIISCIIGFASIYSWFGKPQKVACGFQPWLLGIAIISLVSALISKTFRIWRIFKSPFQKKMVTDLELIILWVIMVLPAIIILALWTLISTPSAALVEVQGEKHYICVTGGFTGPPGGFVFFFIFVGYTGIVLLFGVFLTIVTRDVPSLFNESKLIALSIYNLVFLSVVVIPVVIVLNEINPFISWIIRTLAILYAFLATLLLQFAPKFFAIIFLDRGKDKLFVNKSLMDWGDASNTGTGASLSQNP